MPTYQGVGKGESFLHSQRVRTPGPFLNVPWMPDILHALNKIGGLPCFEAKDMKYLSRLEAR